MMPVSTKTRQNMWLFEQNAEIEGADPLAYILLGPNKQLSQRKGKLDEFILYVNLLILLK